MRKQTRNNLTRWLDLFEKDETLRPDNLMFIDSENSEDAWYTKIPAGRIPQSTTVALISAQAILWLNTMHESLTIGDGQFDDTYQGEWPSGFSVQVLGPIIDVLRSGEDLIDALYRVVVVVMEHKEEMKRKARRNNSLLRRSKRRIKRLVGCIFNRFIPKFE